MARHPIGLLPNLAQPEYSRQWYSGQGAELRRSVFRITAWSMTVFIAGFALLAVFRESIIRLPLGGEFSGAAPLLLILIPGALPVAAAFRMLPAAAGCVWLLLVTGTAALAIFLTALLLAPEYGATGAAWARTLFALTGLLLVIPFALAMLCQS